MALFWSNLFVEFSNVIFVNCHWFRCKPNEFVKRRTSLGNFFIRCIPSSHFHHHRSKVCFLNEKKNKNNQQGLLILFLKTNSTTLASFLNVKMSFDIDQFILPTRKQSIDWISSHENFLFLQIVDFIETGNLQINIAKSRERLLQLF